LCAKLSRDLDAATTAMVTFIWREQFESPRMPKSFALRLVAWERIDAVKVAHRQRAATIS
jgi:hypothetical protein